MENRWGILQEEGYESIIVALDDRFNHLMQKAKEGIEKGEEKIIAALPVEVRMTLFIDSLPRFFDMDSACMALQTVRNSICSEFDIEMSHLVGAKDRIVYLSYLEDCHYRSTNRTNAFSEEPL